VALASGDLPLEVVASMGAGRDRGWQTGVPGGALARQVFTTGRPVVVPRASREPALGERHPGDGEASFVCVPLPLNRRATGVLSVELRFKAERDYERTGKFFGVIASMIAQAIKVQRLLEAEREGLVQENVRLQGELRERYDFSHILGTSRAMHAVCEQMMQVTCCRSASSSGSEALSR
jgi:Nif-specific regulatory protein